MKKFLSLMALTAVLFTACKKDTQAPQGAQAGNTITLTANMPGENRTTLAADADNNISVSWEQGDVINLCFVQNTTKAVGTATIASITNNGKTGTFTFTLPQGINAANPYDLYGVYGAAGLSIVNDSAVVKLKAFPDTIVYAGIENLSNAKCIAMKFVATNIQPGANVTAVFEHLGTVISAYVKNTSATDYGVKKKDGSGFPELDTAIINLQLSPDIDAWNWHYELYPNIIIPPGFIYNYYTKEKNTENISIAEYNLFSGKMVAGKECSSYMMQFSLKKFKANDITKLSTWIIPAGIAPFTAMKMSTYYKYANAMNFNQLASDYKIPAKVLAAGKHHIIYAVYDGTELKIADKNYVPKPS